MDIKSARLFKKYRALESMAKAIKRRGFKATMEYNPYDELAEIQEEMHEIAEELGLEEEEEN